MNEQLKQNITNDAIEVAPQGETTVVEIQGYEANRLADVSLHKEHLSFARKCLKHIETQNVDDTLVKDALWRCALTNFFQCFSESAKFILSAGTIFLNDTLDDLKTFEAFMSVHNRYQTHDRNSYKYVIPGAVINHGTTDYKVEKICCFATQVGVMNEENFNNLLRLVDIAIEWVDAEYEIQCGCLAMRLEAEPYESLAKRSPVDTSSVVEIT